MGVEFGFPPSVGKLSKKPQYSDKSHRFQLIVVDNAEPVPIEAIAPREPKNEIDVENFSYFELLNRIFSIHYQPRKSKRLYGDEPDLVPSKKFKHKGESSSTPSLLDPDFTFGNYSSDEDFELFSRANNATGPKNMVPSKQVEISSSDEEIVDTKGTRSNAEDELSLAQFLLNLKEEKALKKFINEDDEPDTEMQKKFEDNRPGWSEKSVSESNSEEYTEEGDDVEDNDVFEDNVYITLGNIDVEDYDMSKSFSRKF